MTLTPLRDRIEARKGRRIGPVSPVPLTGRMSEFSKRLAEKRLHVTDLTVYNGAVVPDGEGGAA